MENNKIEKLYRDALKNNYGGNFNDFVTTYFPSENKHFVNDTGKPEVEPQRPAAENIDQQPIQRPMYAERPVVNPYRQEAGPISAPVSKADDDDDKIFGMNKYLVFALTALAILGVGFGAWVYFNKPKANKLGEGGNPGDSNGSAVGGPPSESGLK